MKGAVFAALLGATALVSLPALAQTAAPEQPAQQAGAGSRGPANLCQELIAYVRQATAPAAAPAAAAAQAPQPSPAQQVAPAAPPSAGAVATAQPPGRDAPSQSGISGPVSQAQTQGTPGPQAAGQSPAVTQPQTPAAPQPGGQAPPPAQAAAAAPAAPQPPKPTAEHLAKLEAAAQGNDLTACRNYGQQMRRAGMVMPPPLIALAGLDLKYLQQAPQPQQQ